MSLQYAIYYYHSVKKKLKSYAKRNFEMSKLYTLSILESRRDSFIKEFLDYVHLQK